MSRPVDPLPTSLGRVFSSQQARRVGVGSRRLLQPDLVREGYGVYRHSSLDDGAQAAGRIHSADQSRRAHWARALVVATTLPIGHFYSGITAAVVWDLPVDIRETDPLEVACFDPRRPSRRSDLSTRMVRETHAAVTTHRGVSVTTPVSTWVMLAPRLSLRDGVALGDAIIREHRVPGTTRLQRRPLGTLEQLTSTVEAGRRVGGQRLREMLPLLSTQSASAPESHLRLLLHDWGMACPRLDFDVHDADGRLLGCSEFAYPAELLALEYEGGQHRIEVAQWNRDIDKYRDYANAGWEVIRVTAQLLYREPERLRGQIAEALRRRGWHPA